MIRTLKLRMKEKTMNLVISETLKMNLLSKKKINKIQIMLKKTISMILRNSKSTKQTKQKKNHKKKKH